ncbi:Rab-like protein 2A [Boothiomyces sp. JEL0866]|nr:Rab-like protein 2A [Boothiomyces sp. JEL0866]
MKIKLPQNPCIYSQVRTKFPSVIPAVYSDRIKEAKENVRRVFIQNIPFGTSADELYEFLEGFGYAQKCEIAFNKATREPKQFGFANIEQDAADYLIQNSSKIPFKGGFLSIKYDAEAEPKKKWGGIPEYRQQSTLPYDKHDWKQRARSWEEAFNKKNKKQILAQLKMADVISVPEFAFYEFFNKTIQVPYKRIFVVFYGSIDPNTGESWCGDTRKALPLIRKTLSKVQHSVLLLVAAGDRETYKFLPNHPYKIDPVIKLQSVPTLIEYDHNGPIAGKRLEDKESGDQELLDKFIKPNKSWFKTQFEKFKSNLLRLKVWILSLLASLFLHAFMKDIQKIEKPADLKIILLGDSAVGKSKLMERYLLDDYIPHQSSTYALTLYRHVCPNPKAPTENLEIDFWDTAGQERFQSMHASYYHGAHCCILVFDVTRKITYKNLDTWYEELISHRGIKMPVIVVANKIDMDPSRATKSFAFVEKRRIERGGNEQDLPFYFVSASDGSNVVTIFKEAIAKASVYREDLASGKAGTFVDEVLQFIKDEEQRPDGLFKPSVPPVS